LTEAVVDPPELAHFRARLDRARGHFAHFGTLWAGYLETRPHRMTVETSTDGSATIRVVRDLPVPNDLPLVLGEFLYQLRAALDNCLYAVAVIDSGQNPPPNATLLEWPICSSPERWSGQARRLGALSEEIRNSLETIQPYQAQRPDWNCLRILHDLARTDRHRALHLVTTYNSYGNAMVDLERITDFRPRIGVIDDEAVIATFQWIGADRTLTPDIFDMNVEFEVEIAGTEESSHPDGGVPQRPWGGLDKRLRALHMAVTDYTFGLVQIARKDRGPQ
jgi:hypothetical protein